LQGADRASLPVTPGAVPRVSEGGGLAASRSGYAPGTAVGGWVFSAPPLLGPPLPDATGAFSALFDIPVDTPLGQHTLITEGTEPSGASLSLRLGIEVQAGDEVVEFAHCPVASDWFVSASRGSDANAGSS